LYPDKQISQTSLLFINKEADDPSWHPVLPIYLQESLIIESLCLGVGLNLCLWLRKTNWYSSGTSIDGHSSLKWNKIPGGEKEKNSKPGQSLFKHWSRRGKNKKWLPNPSCPHTQTCGSCTHTHTHMQWIHMFAWTMDIYMLALMKN